MNERKKYTIFKIFDSEQEMRITCFDLKFTLRRIRLLIRKLSRNKGKSKEREREEKMDKQGSSLNRVQESKARKETLETPQKSCSVLALKIRQPFRRLTGRDRITRSLD